MREKKINTIRIRRKIRNSAGVIGTKARPRFSIFRSNAHLYAQFIDDNKGETLVSASTRELERNGKISKTENAKVLGKVIAEKAKKAGIKTAVVDRGSYKYHGRIKAVVEAVRENGLKI